MRPAHIFASALGFFLIIIILTLFEPNIEKLQLKTIWTFVLGISAGFGGSLAFYVVFSLNRPKLTIKDNVNIERFNMFWWRYTIEVKNESWTELIDNEALLYVYITNDRARDSEKTIKLAGRLRTPKISRYNKRDQNEKYIHRFEFICRKKLGVIHYDNYLRFTLHCKHGKSNISGAFTRDISNYTIIMKGNRIAGNSLKIQDKLDDQLAMKIQ